LTRKKKRTTAGADPATPTRVQARRSWWARFRDSPLGVQILAGVVTAGLLGAGAAAAPQVIDPAALGDHIRGLTRGDDDLRYTVSFIDGGYDLVLPPGLVLTDQQRAALRHWSLPGVPDGGEPPIVRLAAQLRAAGAADPNVLTLRITLEGRRNEKVKIDDIEAVDVKRQPRFANVLVLGEPQGPRNTIPMMFNLDEFRPVVRTAEPIKATDPVKPTEKDDVRPGPPFFQRTQLTLGDGEENALVVQSITTRQAVSFRIRISYRLGADRKTLTIDNAGHPFAVTPVNCTDASKPSHGKDGHAAYREVWQMRNAMDGADPVATPSHFSIGYPYC
jgi:hypothetical protein